MRTDAGLPPTSCFTETSLKQADGTEIFHTNHDGCNYDAGISGGPIPAGSYVYALSLKTGDGPQDSTGAVEKAFTVV